MNPAWDQSPDGILFNQGNFGVVSSDFSGSESAMSFSVFFNRLPCVAFDRTETAVFNQAILKDRSSRSSRSFSCSLSFFCHMAHGTPTIPPYHRTMSLTVNYLPGALPSSHTKIVQVVPHIGGYGCVQIKTTGS